MAIPRFPDGACLPIDVASNTAISSALRLALPGTANTKSAYTQLVASTANDINLLHIELAINAQTTSGDTFAIDIAVGAAGSEVVIIPDLVLGWANFPIAMQLTLPINIPAGSRIAVRVQSGGNNASNRAAVSIQGYCSNVDGYAGVDAIGYNSAATKGTSMTPGAANVKGSYAQLISSTARAYSGIFFTVDCLFSAPARLYLIDLAIGAAASEVIMIPNIYVNFKGADSGGCTCSGFIPMSIAAGTRIAARCQQDSTASAIQITAYGVY